MMQTLEKEFLLICTEMTTVQLHANAVKAMPTCINVYLPCTTAGETNECHHY